MKLVIAGLAGVLVVAGSAGLVAVNLAIAAVSDCAGYQPKKEPFATALFGRVAKVEQKPGWIVTHVSLCQSAAGGLLRFRVYTPRENTLFDLGEAVTVAGTGGYHWLKQPTAEFGRLVVPGKTFAVQPEALGSEQAVLDLFGEFPDFNCLAVPICRSRLEFLKSHGSSQLRFLDHLSRRQVLPLLIDFASGQAVVYGNKFGAVASLEEFQRLWQGWLL